MQEKGDAKGLGDCFSPDGKTLVFYKYLGEDYKSARIYTVKPNRKGLKEITGNYAIGMHTELRWSHDGQKIGFTSFEENGAKILEVDLKTQKVKEPASSDEGAATNLLSARLKMLESLEVITKRKLPGNKKENIYLPKKESI